MFQLRSLLRDHNAQDRVLTHVSTVNEEKRPSRMILEAQQTCCYSCGGPVPCLSTRSHPIQLVACAMRHNFDDRHTCTCMLMVMSSCPSFMVAIMQPRNLLMLRSGTYATANAALSLDVAYLCMTRQWKLSASASAHVCNASQSPKRNSCVFLFHSLPHWPALSGVPCMINI